MTNKCDVYFYKRVLLSSFTMDSNVSRGAGNTMTRSRHGIRESKRKASIGTDVLMQSFKCVSKIVNSKDNLTKDSQ